MYTPSTALEAGKYIAFQMLWGIWRLIVILSFLMEKPRTFYGFTDFCLPRFRNTIVILFKLDIYDK